MLKRITKYWVPVIFWAIVIFLLSSRKLPDVSTVYWQEFIFKKTSHVIFYGIHGILIYRALKASGLSNRKAIILAGILAIIYGISDEFHQSFIPGREPRIRDLGFDSFGVVLALYLIKVLLPKSPDSVKSWAKRLEIL